MKTKRNGEKKRGVEGRVRRERGGQITTSTGVARAWGPTT